jgi:hypothetical protein
VSLPPAIPAHHNSEQKLKPLRQSLTTAFLEVGVETRPS